MAKYRVVESCGQFFPEKCDWLFGWRDLRDTDRYGPVPCFTIEAALAIIRDAAPSKHRVVWEATL
jgi:hypothetical protein